MCCINRNDCLFIQISTVQGVDILLSESSVSLFFCSCTHTLFKLPIEDPVHCLKFIFTFITDLLLCLNFEEIVCTGLYD